MGQTHTRMHAFQLYAALRQTHRGCGALAQSTTHVHMHACMLHAPACMPAGGSLHNNRRQGRAKPAGVAPLLHIAMHGIYFDTVMAGALHARACPRLPTAGMGAPTPTPHSPRVRHAPRPSSPAVQPGTKKPRVYGCRAPQRHVHAAGTARTARSRPSRAGSRAGPARSTKAVQVSTSSCRAAAGTATCHRRAVRPGLGVNRYGILPSLPAVPAPPATAGPAPPHRHPAG